MITAYIAAAVLCALAANQARGGPHDQRGGAAIAAMQRECRLWRALAVLLAALAIYRQLDLAELVTGLGRTLAIHGKWYNHRRPFQLAMVCTIAIFVLCGAAAIFRQVADVNPPALIAFAACTVLVLLLGINALSLHWIDQFLHSGYHRVTVYNLIEAGSLATILAANFSYHQQAPAVPQR